MRYLNRLFELLACLVDSHDYTYGRHRLNMVRKCRNCPKAQENLGGQWISSEILPQ